MVRVLLVEDSIDCAKAFKTLLGFAGYDVDVAHNYGDAVNLIGNNCNFDLLITDINLPDGNGLDLLSKIQGRACKGIVISGDSPRSVKGINEAGFSVFLQKPVMFDQLKSVIAGVLDA